MNKSFFFDRFVMRRNYRELMISLEEGDKKINELAKHSGMAYQHLCSVMQEAQKENIIISKRKDHSLNFNLTHKGEMIKELCIGLKMCVENWEDDKTIVSLNKLKFVKAKEKPKVETVSDKSAVITPPDGGENGKSPTETEDRA